MQRNLQLMGVKNTGSGPRHTAELGLFDTDHSWRQGYQG